MTLYKQLIILIITLFLGLFLSVFYIGSNNLRDYINTQLSSHAQDAATSLGIAISSEMAEKDLFTPLVKMKLNNVVPQNRIKLVEKVVKTIEDEEVISFMQSAEGNHERFITSIKIINVIIYFLNGLHVANNPINLNIFTLLYLVCK